MTGYDYPKSYLIMAPTIGHANSFERVLFTRVRLRAYTDTWDLRPETRDRADYCFSAYDILLYYARYARVVSIDINYHVSDVP